MRVNPRPALAFAVGIGYAVLFLVLELIVSIDYDKIGENTHNVIWGIVIPVAIGSLVLAVLTTVLGWWRPVLREQPTDPPRPPRWMLAIPLVVLAITLVGIPWGDLGSIGGAFLLWLAIGTLLVGFSEEITYRGLAVVGLRGGSSEVRVWIWSSVLFGLLHGVNVVLGQGIVPTIRQVIFAFVLGSVFYAIRRTTGTIIVGMVLHGMWDFSTFARAAETDTTAVRGTVDIAAAGIGLVQSLLSLAAVVLFIVGARKLFPKKAPAAPAAETEAVAS
jgi:membrane protease YdiL (CAAX protease family)